jgi:hypothetical protein
MEHYVGTDSVKFFNVSGAKSKVFHGITTILRVTWHYSVVTDFLWLGLNLHIVFLF